MRILFINDHYSLLGGKEHHIHALGRALRDAGHAVGIIHADAPFESDDTQIHFWIPELQTRRSERAISRVAGCLDLFCPDVVHLEYNTPNFGVIRFLTKCVPVLRSVHDAEFFCPIRYYMQTGSDRPCGAAFGAVCFQSNCLSPASPSSWKALLQTWRRAAAHRRFRMSTQSEFIKQGLVRIGFASDSIGVLPLFVDRIEEDPGWNEPVFLCVGRLNAKKGLHVAIEAVSKVARPARLEIIGEGAERANLEALAGRLNVGDRVAFRGRLGRADLIRSYLACRALLLPSTMPENSSLVIQEAMAAGKPVIATALGGNPELVTEGVTGCLVPHGQPAELAGRMDRLAADADLARRLGSAGRAFIRGPRFQKEHHLAALIREYERAMQGFR